MTVRFRRIFLVCFVFLLFVVESNQSFSRRNNLTIQTRKIVLSKQVLVPEIDKRKYQLFFYSVNHLNQRRSPSATLVSKEIYTDFRFVFFSKVAFPRTLQRLRRLGFWLRGFARVGGVCFAGEFLEFRRSSVFSAFL